MATLTGCSAIDDLTGDRSLTGQKSSLLTHLPAFDDDEYEGDALTVQSFIPTDLGDYAQSSRYLQILDRAFPREFDVNLRSLIRGDVVLDGTIVSLTAASGESFSDIITNPGSKSGTIGSYEVYEHKIGLLALNANQLMFVRPDSRVKIEPQEVLDRSIQSDSTRTASTSEHPAATRTIEAVGTDHYLSLSLPFNQDVFPEKTEHVPGAQAAGLGVTVGEKEQGDVPMTARVAASFPSDTPEESMTSALAQNTDIRANQYSVKENIATGKNELKTSAIEGENPYLIPRLSNSVLVQARGSRWKWKFDYPEHDISGAKELVLPVDRPAVIGATSSDLIHALSAPVYQFKIGAEPGPFQYGSISPSEKKEFTVYCAEFCGKGHDEMTAPGRVISSSAFESWLASK